MLAAREVSLTPDRDRFAEVARGLWMLGMEARLDSESGGAMAAGIGARFMIMSPASCCSDGGTKRG